jgi:hypothetical protein
MRDVANPRVRSSGLMGHACELVRSRGYDDGLASGSEREPGPVWCRASFSQERMTYIPEESRVLYRSKDGKSGFTATLGIRRPARLRHGSPGGSTLAVFQTGRRVQGKGIAFFRQLSSLPQRYSPRSTFPTSECSPCLNRISRQNKELLHHASTNTMRRLYP